MGDQNLLAEVVERSLQILAGKYMRLQDPAQHLRSVINPGNRPRTSLASGRKVNALREEVHLEPMVQSFNGPTDKISSEHQVLRRPGALAQAMRQPFKRSAGFQLATAQRCAMPSLHQTSAAKWKVDLKKLKQNNGKSI